MKGKAKIKKIAHAMFIDSLTSSYPDPAKVRIVLKTVAANPAPQISKILKIYKNLIKRAIAAGQITIEAAVPLNPKEIEVLIARTGTKKALQKTNSKMVFGARITHGDWVYDASLDAKLAQLTMSENSEYSVSQNNQRTGVSD